MTLVELVALLYKNQSCMAMQELVTEWLSSSLAENTEGIETNTSPNKNGLALLLPT